MNLEFLNAGVGELLHERAVIRHELNAEHHALCSQGYGMPQWLHEILIDTLNAFRSTAGNIRSPLKLPVMLFRRHPLLCQPFHKLTHITHIQREPHLVHA